MFSWGRFRNSESTLQSILSMHNVFLPFLDLINAYGFKVHEDEHNWIGYRSHISITPAIGSESRRYGKCALQAVRFHEAGQP